jgi:outer membrane lipoprotein-sorting protein
MKNQLIITALLLATLPAVGQVSLKPNATADEVMATMFDRDTQREALAAGYSGSREYLFDNVKLSKRAEMLVSVTCDPAGTKHFQVVSEEGWKSAHKHVLHKMLESESDSSQPTNRPKTRIISENYDFQMVEVGTLGGRPTYVIDALPKRQDKYLFRGRIWVDAEDYALARVEGEPAKAPSFWTRSVHFVQQYQKNGTFWFPVQTTSITEARFFGTTRVDIHYFDYTPLSSKARGIAGPEFREAHYVHH